LDALVYTLISTVLLGVPCAVLMAGGILLWRRWRSTATALIALGFAVALLSLASGLFQTYRTHAVLLDMSRAPQFNQDTLFIVAHYHRLPLVGVLGLWVAAAGTLWHLMRHR
jgi:hypothetical protein